MFLERWVSGASACIVGVGLSAEQTCPLTVFFKISFKCDTGVGRARRPPASEVLPCPSRSRVYY